MAILNSRNESNKFIKQVGEDFVHKPADSNEDITVNILDVNSDKTFNVFSDEACNNLVGNFKVIFRPNDGVYLNLSEIMGIKLYGDIDFKDSILISNDGEQKLLDWANLNSSTVINTVLGVL